MTRRPREYDALVRPLRIYNSLTRSVEPILRRPGAVALTFYSCGPTVYDDAHIGNFRSFLGADLLRRALELIGHRVVHVMNITDVGHMTDDASADGAGEDKMSVAGRRIAEAKKSGSLPEGASIDPSDPVAIADFYAARFLEDARLLGLKVAHEAEALRAAGSDPGRLMPRPSRCIPEMVEMIERLIARGHAYQGPDGAVYFDVRSFPAYGSLSGNTLDRLREGAGERIQAANQAAKRHPADFLLWKPDPRHLMRWPSPWGEGYPGWHIECSAMAQSLLGDEIDLHSGGEDNIFPHHECEIAQSCGCSGSQTFARHWFHARHLLVDGEKMSKSKGNFHTPRGLFARGITPAALRLELLRTHYRTNANFTMQGVQDCQRMVDRWCRAHSSLAASASAAHSAGRVSDESAEAGPFERALGEFTDALCDDLNAARSIAALNVAVGAGTPPACCPFRELSSLLSMDSVLAVLGRNAPVSGPAAGGGEFEARVGALLARRTAARAAKDWAESDRIREELAGLGVLVKDGPGGPTWTRS
jgi:cysteinyl-tRNA synthetase